jgi:hypothetical protein
MADSHDPMREALSDTKFVGLDGTTGLPVWEVPSQLGGTHRVEAPRWWQAVIIGAFKDLILAAKQAEKQAESARPAE